MIRRADDAIAGMVFNVVDTELEQVAQRELQIFRDEATRANSAKSAFMSRMSHELRTPLNAVLGFAQLLQIDNENLKPKQNEGINHILAGGDHLLRLIEDVLDFSRIDSGHTPLNLQRFSLVQEMQTALSMVSLLAEKNRITIHSPAADSADVIGDPHRSRQILVNLLSNAIKYNKPGGTIAVSISTVPDLMTRICIKDSGRGIHPSDRARLFEPFERVVEPHCRIEGTGIGLSICKKLAGLMGGSIDFDSEVGIGSTFWFDIPTASATDCESFAGDATTPA
ncbi:MAG: HAMP domain-containing histidine kinase [Xanthomonadales bacterium]|nr:HAMP domain-containing histidine kinase [Xanthomonadales bacterium]